MDASTDAAVEQVRAKRIAIDNRLELLRVRLQQVDPRGVPARSWANTVLPILAFGTAVWLWRRRRRSVRSLADLLAHEVATLYGAELAIARALRRMQGQASTPELRIALGHSRAESDDHIERLVRVFRSMGERPRGTAPAGVVGIIAEADGLVRRRVHRRVRDAALVTAAQRLAHYQIAAYGTARTHADVLGYTHAGLLLQQTIDEERMFDEHLDTLAARFVNYQTLRRRPTGV